MIDISVIITTKNEEANIQKCIESINEQIYSLGKIEIILVDNNSTDKTVAIANRYTDKVYNHSPERSAQRNYGVKQAVGKYILYLDADMVLSPEVIAQCVEKCEQKGCIALYIPERVIGKGFWVKVRDFERSFYDATCIDCVRFVRRDKFLEIGGFDEDLTGPEDWDFDRRIREIGRVDIIKSPIYHSELSMTLKNYINKKLYYAKSFKRYCQKWGNDRIISKQLGFYYRYFGVFIENGKWKRFSVHPLLALGVYFLRVIVGFVYLVLRKES